MPNKPKNPRVTGKGIISNKTMFVKYMDDRPSQTLDDVVDNFKFPSTPVRRSSLGKCWLQKESILEEAKENFHTSSNISTPNTEPILIEWIKS